MIDFIIIILKYEFINYNINEIPIVLFFNVFKPSIAISYSY